MEYDNNNSGVLFRNAKKENEKQPDYTGSVDIEGTEYWLSGWKRTAKGSGNTFISIKLQDKNESNEQKQENKEEIPF